MQVGWADCRAEKSERHNSKSDEQIPRVAVALGMTRAEILSGIAGKYRERRQR
jgi:hypothetical protein